MCNVATQNVLLSPSEKDIYITDSCVWFMGKRFEDASWGQLPKDNYHRFSANIIFIITVEALGYLSLINK